MKVSLVAEEVDEKRKRTGGDVERAYKETKTKLIEWVAAKSQDIRVFFIEVFHDIVRGRLMNWHRAGPVSLSPMLHPAKFLYRVLWGPVKSSRFGAECGENIPVE
jgi:hypothetical protein